MIVEDTIHTVASWDRKRPQGAPFFTEVDPFTYKYDPLRLAQANDLMLD
jgi:hypothetical protein